MTNYSKKNFIEDIKEIAVGFILFLGAIGSLFLFVICIVNVIPKIFALLPFALSFLTYQSIKYKKLKNHLWFFVSIVCSSILTITFSIYLIYSYIYIPKVTLNEKKDGSISSYTVFSVDSELATLDEPSTLLLNKNKLPRVDGATALFPVYAAFVNETYPCDIPLCNQEDGVLFYKNTVGAYKELILGNRDIIFCAAPSKKQLEFAKENDVELILTPIGKEAFVFFVNEKNPISNLSEEQIKSIYSGEFTNWKQVGGKNTKIKAFQRAENSGSQSQLVRFMGEKTLMIPPQKDVATFMDGIIKETQNYRNARSAIGFSFRFYIQDMYESKGIKLLCINDVEPTIENISSGKYPLTDNFYAVTTQNSKNTEELIEWILSEQGQELIVKTGYVGVK